MDEWTGQNPHAANRGGLREALLVAAGAAAIGGELDTQTTVPPGGAYSWHIGPSTRPFVDAIPGRKEALTLTCEEPGGTVLETLSLVIDRGRGVALRTPSSRSGAHSAPACGSGEGRGPASRGDPYARPRVP